MENETIPLWLLLIFLGTFYMQVQVTEQRARNTELLSQLHTANRTVNLLSYKHREKEQEFVYKYQSPMNKEDYNKLTSPFGYREMLNPFTGGQVTSEHKGLDLVGNWHCEIKPIGMNGKVIDKWYPPSSWASGHEVFGGYVRIQHKDNWISSYAHLSSIYVKEGDMLIDGLFYRNGQVLPSKGILGRQGNTGMSIGEHLHLSIQNEKGEFVDPLRWIEL